MKQIKFILTILCFLVSHCIFAQEPFHFFLGEDILSSADIYGINQDPKGCYWITTDVGLLSYDGYNFHQYANPKTLGSSLFRPKFDHSGKVYCNNLNGQIFTVNNGSLELFHQVPDSLLSFYMDFDFSPTGELLVFSKGYYRVSNGKITPLYTPLGNTDMMSQDIISSDCEGNKLLRLPRSTSILKLQDANIEEITIINDSLESLLPRKLSCYQDHLLGVKDDGKLIWLKKELEGRALRPIHILKEDFNHKRLHITRSGLYAINSDVGIEAFDLQYDPKDGWVLKGKENIMTDYFISTVHEDHEGNLLLGTFKKGIIVIPKGGSKSDLFPGISITEVEASSNDELFLGDISGRVFKVSNGKQEILTQLSNKRVEKLMYVPDTEALFFMLDQTYILSKQKNGYSQHIFPITLKEALWTGGAHYTIATNLGLTSVDLVKNEYREFPQNLGRTYAITTRQEGEMVVSTAKGLVVVPQGNKKEYFIKYKGERIISPCLARYQDKTLIGTRRYGVLLLEGNRVTQLISSENGLFSNIITQIAVRDHKVYVASTKGLQIFNIEGQLIKNIGFSDGLRNNIVSDFAVSDKTLWMLDQYGLHNIPLSEVFSERKLSTIQEIKVFNRDLLLAESDLKEGISYSENRISFQVIAPSLAFMHDLSYSYRLIGVDQESRKSDYLENTIVYNSLPPGTYTFQVSLLLNGRLQDSQEVMITIEKPYWLSWLFWLTIFILMSAILFSYFKYRIRLLNKRAKVIEELHSNKLVALQNQLNPHFIFNALISIQSYMLQNDASKAATYMGYFSKLMRQVLEHSRVEFISLSDEIAMLTNYMTLLQLQSEEGFEYDIAIDGSIEDEEEIHIPPMFVQPFVENAIEHGLINNNGHVQVTFKEAQGFIGISVIDNGVGLSTKKEGVSEKKTTHHSLATSIIKERIAVFNQKLGADMKLVVSEMKDEQQEVLGTKVTLTVPFQIR